ncbi:MAG: helix-turn-helix domain-containing protein [Candidatus Omnitrophica bacterium]|nr:helix-turn-helix domain-containing protein [Candidatus Omnitrophota bacterium]
MPESTVGTQLQSARAALRLSLKDISNATKIQPWVLEALERDELQKTMNPIYVKGFVATYAKCLHLDPHALLQQLYPPVAVVEETTPQMTPMTKHDDTDTSHGSWPTLSLPWPLIRRVATAAAGAVVVIGLVKANPLRRFSLSAPRQEANLTIAREPSTVRPETLTIPLNQSLELKLIARRSTWISVEGDGRLLTQREVSAGTQETWKAKRQVKLIVAKPFHVDILLNGQSISPLLLAHQGRLLIQHRSISALPSSPGSSDLTVRAGVSAE